MLETVFLRFFCNEIVSDDFNIKKIPWSTKSEVYKEKKPMPNAKLKSLVDQHLPQFKKETLFLTRVPPPKVRQ